MNKTFVSMCQMTQKQLKSFVATQLNATYEKVHVDKGYVYAEGTFPVLLVAHLDTVHKELPQKIYYDPDSKILSSPQGIGGDDRCGVFMVLEVARRYHCSILFCEDEEIGAVGAYSFTDSEIAKTVNVNYIIEFDRKGHNDAVFYDCDNADFTTFITKDFYEKAYGSFSDISVLAPFLGCAAVNLSCGYYNAHFKDEYIVIPEMENSINAACNILARTTADDKFEYIESPYSYRNSYDYGWYDEYDMYQYKTNYIIEFVADDDQYDWFEVLASSKEEAVGKFCMEFTTMTFDDIIDVYKTPETVR